MPIQHSSVPTIAAHRFAAGWPAYEIPAVWVDLVKKWTPILMEIDPEFKYQQITVKFDTQARVHIETNRTNFARFRGLIKQMNKELSEALPANNRSY